MDRNNSHHHRIRKFMNYSFIIIVILYSIISRNSSSSSSSDCLFRQKRHSRFVDHYKTAANNDRHSHNRQLALAPALLLTTMDTISLVYPKEMGYEKDFLHVIYKINNNKSPENNQQNNASKTKLEGVVESTFRIEDAVYDNHTWSVYLIVSNSSGGSELIRLKRNLPDFMATKMQPHPSPPPITRRNDSSDVVDHPYQLASNWTRHVVYRNSSIKMLSLDINVQKRRLYWFEFDKTYAKWSIVLLNRLDHVPKLRLRLSYFVFEQQDYEQFSSDGYSFITVARDNLKKTTAAAKENPGGTAFAKSVGGNKKQQPYHDIIVFISNNQTLNICYLINMTCENFFKAPNDYTNNEERTTEPPNESKTKKPDYDDFNSIEFDDNEEYSDDSDDLAATTTTFTTTAANTMPTKATRRQTNPPIYRFGRLIGLNYDPNEHALYLADYGYDRIEKITFEKEIDYDSFYSFKFKSMDSILKSSSGQQQHAPLNPMMSVYRDSHIYWIDYEEGLKVTVYKSSCVRTIYKVKEAGSLKFVEIGTWNKRRSSSSNQQFDDENDQQLNNNNNNNNLLLNRLVSLQDYSIQSERKRFQYPPDYYFYYTNGLANNNDNDNNNNNKFFSNNNLNEASSYDDDSIRRFNLPYTSSSAVSSILSSYQKFLFFSFHFVIIIYFIY